MWGQPPSAVRPSAARRGLCGESGPAHDGQRSNNLSPSPPRPLRNRLPTTSRQLRRRPAPQQLLQGSVRIDRRRMIGHHPAGIRRGAIVAVNLPAQYAKHRHQLSAMMRRMRNPPHHDPSPRPRHVKEFDLLFPPSCVFRFQRRQPLPAVFHISRDEIHPGLLLRQWRRTYINPEHVAEPQVFTHALMHHLLQHAAPSRVGTSRPDDQVLIRELAPHTYNLDPFCCVRLNQECISHGGWHSIFLGSRRSRQQGYSGERDLQEQGRL